MPTSPAISTIGVAATSTPFPNEGSATGTVVIQPGDIVILPYCRYVIDPVQLGVREAIVTKIEAASTPR